jgi:heme O synthase-like polyprenyltransferase
MRPIPRGRVSRAEALAFGLVLAAFSIAVDIVRALAERGSSALEEPVVLGLQ